MHSGFGAWLNAKRRGRGSKAARSRLAKGIFSFLMQPDECTKRALLERRTFVRKLERKKSLLNARRQRSAYAPSSPPCDYGQSPRASRRNTPSARAHFPRQDNERSKSRSRPCARGREARDAGGIPGCSPWGRKGFMGEDMRTTDDAAGCIVPRSAAFPAHLRI